VTLDDRLQAAANALDQYVDEEQIERDYQQLSQRYAQVVQSPMLRRRLDVAISSVEEQLDVDDATEPLDTRDPYRPDRGQEPTARKDAGRPGSTRSPDDPMANVELFAGLEPDVRQRVIATAVPRTYRKGQILFVEGDPGESLIILKRGAVAVFRTAPTGERAVLTVARPPNVLGEVSLLDALSRSASAEAIEDTQALALNRAAFIELVHSNPRILDAVMRSVGALIRRLTEQNADHVFLDLPGRVAKTLVRLAGENQAPMITIELNQSQLAEMAGGSRQSVNQAIGSFASRGWLRTEGRRIVVTDMSALRRRAGIVER